MRRPGCALLTLLSLGACRFDDRVPGGVQLACTSDAECPSGQRCQTGTQRCVTTLDSTPPDVSVTPPVYTPPPGSPVLQALALAPGGAAVISFSTSEALGPPAVVVGAPAYLACPVSPLGPTSFSARCTLNDGAPQVEQSVQLSVTVQDAAGNAATRLLGPLDVDSLPPPAPDTDNHDIVYRRIPYGADETKGTPTFTVRGGPGATQGAEVVFALTNGVSLGQASVQADGSFGPAALVPIDAPSLDLIAADRAGNVSAPARVHAIEWVATLGGKIADSQVENPHRLEAFRAFADTVVRYDGVEKGAADGVDLTGGAALTIQGGRSWRNRTFAETDYSAPAVAAAYDERRGRLVRFGGAVGESLPDTATEWNGLDWSVPPASDPEGDLGPSGRQAPSLAWDDALGGVLIYGGLQPGRYFDDLWLWDGVSFKSLPAGPGPRAGAGLWCDRLHGRRIVFGGAYDAGLQLDMWSGDDAGWHPVDGGIPFLDFPVISAWDGDTARGWALGPPGSSSTPVWRFDGDGWVREPDLPAAPQYRRLAYDRYRHRLVAPAPVQVDGGGAGQWFELADADAGWQGTPFPKLAAVTELQYDAARRQIVFGGYFYEPSVGTARAEIWSWDGAAFTRLHQLLESSGQPVALNGLSGRSTGPYARAVGFVRTADDPAGFGELQLTRDGWSVVNAGPPYAPNAAYASNDALGSSIFLVNPQDGGAVTEWDRDDTGAWVLKGPTAIAGLGTSTMTLAPTARSFTLALAVLGPTLQWSPVAWSLGPSYTGPFGEALFSPSITELGDGGFAVTGTQLSTDGGPTGVAPVVVPVNGALVPLAATPLAAGRSIAWDGDRGRIVLFGGFDVSGQATSTLLYVLADGGVEAEPVSDPELDGNPPPRLAGSFAWSPQQHVVIMTAGVSGVSGEIISDTWQLESYGHRPAAVFHVQLAASRAPPQAQWKRLSARAVAGGTGGATVYVWEQGRWQTLVVSAAGPDAPVDTGTLDVTDAQRLSNLLVGRGEATIAVVSTQGNAAEDAQLKLDSVELELSWRQ
jgi:Cys-rich repeat protein